MSKRTKSDRHPVALRRERAETITAPPRWGRRGKIIGLLLLLGGLLLAYLAIGTYERAQYRAAADTARQAARWDQLASITEQWLGVEPDSVTARFYAGEAAAHRGDLVRAAAMIETLPEHDPRAPEAWVRMATLYLGPLNQPLQAEATLKRVIRIEPASIEARRRLISFYGETFQRQQAIDQARDSILVGADAPASYAFQMLPDAIVFPDGADKNRQWLRSGDDDERFTVAKLLHDARHAGIGESLDVDVDTETRRRELEAQGANIRACLRRYPENVSLLAFLLTQAADRGDAEAVADRLAEVPVSAAGDARFWRYKGWLHRTREEWELAEQAFVTAIETDPYEWKSRHQLAEVLRLQGRIDEAEQQLKVATLGVQLRKTLLGLPSIETLPIEVLQQMRDYAEAVEDQPVIQRLTLRIDQLEAAMRAAESPHVVGERE